MIWVAVVVAKVEVAVTVRVVNVGVDDTAIVLVPVREILEPAVS